MNNKENYICEFVCFYLGMNIRRRTLYNFVAKLVNAVDGTSEYPSSLVIAVPFIQVDTVELYRLVNWQCCIGGHIGVKRDTMACRLLYK